MSNAKHLHKDYRGLWYRLPRTFEKRDAQTLVHAVSAYSFLLPRNEDVTYEGLARLIEGAYAPSPRTRELLRVVRLAHQALMAPQAAAA